MKSLPQRNMQLLNLATAEMIASLDDAQVQDLKKNLEQESTTDTSFFITPATIDFLRTQGAHQLAALLENTFADTEGVPVGYAPAPKPGSARAFGRLLTLETATPLTGYKIEVYDEDIAADDLLGWCYSDLRGEFELRFDESDYKDRGPDIEGEPEVKLRISDVDGAQIGWVGIVRAVEADFRDIFVSALDKLVAPVLYPTAGAICPNCGAVYRAGSSICTEDQTILRPLEYET